MRETREHRKRKMQTVSCAKREFMIYVSSLGALELRIAFHAPPRTIVQSTRILSVLCFRHELDDELEHGFVSVNKKTKPTARFAQKYLMRVENFKLN